MNPSLALDSGWEWINSTAAIRLIAVLVVSLLSLSATKFVCGSSKDHTVRYTLNHAGSPMAVSTYTHETPPSSEMAALPSENELTTALDWAQDSAPQCSGLTLRVSQQRNH